MSPKLPLDTLTELARNQSDNAARRLGALLGAQADASRTLQLLQQYREEYSEELQTRMQAGMPSSQWRNYQNFLSTLDGGIEQQRAVAAQAESRLDQGRSDWQHHRRRLNAFDTLADRLQRQQLAAQARREQHDTDERAARQFFDRGIQPAD